MCIARIAPTPLFLSQYWQQYEHGVENLTPGKKKKKKKTEKEKDSSDRYQRNALKDWLFDRVTSKPPTSYRRLRTCCLPSESILQILQLDCVQAAFVAVHISCDITSWLACSGTFDHDYNRQRCGAFILLIDSTNDCRIIIKYQTH